MRLLFLGDLVGRGGRTVVIERLPALIADHKLDFVVVNGENAAGGFGITRVVTTPDGQYFAYNTLRQLSELYLLQGLN